MKIKEIRDLIDYIAQSELNEVNIETSDFKISVKKNPDITLNSSNLAAPSTASQVDLTQKASAGQPETGVEKTADKEESQQNLIEIKSPMIGTFYRSPNPDSASFVEVGDKIKPGQTVCIIEAMKLFNEIESEISGTIVKILAENASPVEFDQPLFLVEPT